VLGGDSPIGLTVIRELGERGVPVHVIARSSDGIGLYSRWTSSRHVRPKDGTATIDLIARISSEHHARLLLTVSEIDLLLVRQAADNGELPGVRVLAPTMHALLQVNNKMATYAAAEAEGVMVPRTWQPADNTDPSETPSNLTFPVVLKWRDPGQVAAELRRAGLTCEKAEYCYDADELRRALARYRPVGRYPMVQEYVPGIGMGHMFYMHEGQALLRFQHLRLAEWPPEGGVSTVCKSLPPSFHAEWLDRSEAMLRRIGWSGAAMVEYRFDPETERCALMEVNGRFWGSLPLAYHSGAHFGWLTYAVQGLGDRPHPAPYRAGLTCRYMIPETRRIITLLFRRSSIQNRNFDARPLRALAQYVISFFRLSTRYYVFTWRDPGPFFADMAFLVLKLIVPSRRGN